MTRQFTKVYTDFLSSEFLNGKEKFMYLLLKSYLPFDKDSGLIYPTLNTLAKQSGMTEKTVRETIKRLRQKGLIEPTQNGLTLPNTYIVKDFAEVYQSQIDRSEKK